MRRAKKAVGLAIAAAALIATGVAIVIPVVRAASADTFVARVPWSSAVISSTTARTLTVLGDVEAMDDRFDCAPVVKSTVSETSTTVTVRLEVFNRPLPPNVACGGVGLSTVPATIHLTSALRGRTLIDGTDKRTHRALVVDRTPALTSVPKPFVRRSTAWDESTRQVSEWSRWQKHGQAQQIDLDFGPAATARRWGPPPPDAKHVRIGRSAGVVWRRAGGDTVTSTVTWSPSVGQRYRLTVIDQSLRPMSEARVVALASAVRAGS